MNLSKIKDQLPKVPDGLEYKQYPVALVLDTIKSMVVLYGIDEVDAVTLTKTAIEHVYTKNQLHLMMMSAEDRYGFWSTMMHLVTWVGRAHPDIRSTITDDIFGIVAPRFGFFSKNKHPVTLALGYTSPMDITSFVLCYRLLNFRMSVVNLETYDYLTYDVKFQDVNMVKDYVLENDAMAIAEYVDGNNNATDLQSCLQYVVSGFRYMGIVDKRGMQFTSAVFLLDGVAYEVSIDVHAQCKKM